MQRDGREDDENVVFHLPSVQLCRSALSARLLPSNSTPLVLSVTQWGRKYIHASGRRLAFSILHTLEDMTLPSEKVVVRINVATLRLFTCLNCSLARALNGKISDCAAVSNIIIQRDEER